VQRCRIRRARTRPQIHAAGGFLLLSSAVP
jgi:hypothetical protein